MQLSSPSTTSICGIDEAGRGALCGSLFVAGFISKQIKDLYNLGIKDSKKTDKKTRAYLTKEIQSLPHTYFHIVQITAREIDHFGISQNMKNALITIIQNLKSFSDQFIFDGNTTFGLHLPNLNTLIKGDASIIQISAASILAKNAKDIEMEKLHQLYPDYNFLSHSGYGTRAHIQTIKKFGITKFHRQSFLKKYINPTLFDNF